MKLYLKNLFVFFCLLFLVSSCNKPVDSVSWELDSDLQEILNTEIEGIEEEKAEMSSNDKLDALRKKLELKWLITKWDMYFDEKEYITALSQYLKVYKEIPTDKEINLKIWNIYYKLKRFPKAYEYYSKIKDYISLDTKTTVYALINWLYNWETDLSYINKEIDSLKLDEQESFYYKNSLVCIDDFSKCRSNFEKYFQALQDSETEITFPDLARIKETFVNYQNFQHEDLQYKSALVTWWFYTNWFYFIAFKTWQNILNEDENYKPIIKIVAKSAYELWDYNTAKEYMLKYNKLEANEADASYFLGRIYEKLGEKLLATVHLNKAQTLWYEDMADIKRRLIFVYYELWEIDKMLKTFKELIDLNIDTLTINDYNLAIYYHILNDDLITALKYCETAKSKFPESELFYWYEAWILLQNEYLGTEELDEIKKIIDVWFEINSKNPMIIMVKWIYELKTKNYTSAFLTFKNARLLDASKEYVESIDYWVSQIPKETRNK